MYGIRRENFVTLKVSEVCKMVNTLGKKKTRLEENKIQNSLKAAVLNAAFRKKMLNNL